MFFLCVCVVLSQSQSSSCMKAVCNIEYNQIVNPSSDW